MSNTDCRRIDRIIDGLLPDAFQQRIIVSVFLESITIADDLGSHKWGVYGLSDRVRLLMGNLIVCTIYINSIWLPLSRKLLEQDMEAIAYAEGLGSWKWDPVYSAYKPVPSQNGYYFASTQHEMIWPQIRKYHSAFLTEVADKYTRLNLRSQSRHSPALIDCLQRRTSQFVPQPDYTTKLGSDVSLPEEVNSQVKQNYYEGTTRLITVNAYERNPKARVGCIQHYGARCSVCNFDFSDIYGEIGAGFIHVHHLVPLNQIGVLYQIDPISDMRPVCPNCHAMLHRRDPPFSIDEMKEILKANA